MDALPWPAALTDTMWSMMACKQGRQGWEAGEVHGD